MGVFSMFTPFSDKMDFTAAIASVVAFQRHVWLSRTVLTPIARLGGMRKGNRFIAVQALALYSLPSCNNESKQILPQTTNKQLCTQ